MSALSHPPCFTVSAQPPFALRRSLAARRSVLGLAAGGLLAAAPMAHAQASGEAEGAEATLPVVTVREQAGPVAVPYAGGQVSSGGRIGLLGDKDFMETPFNTISYTDKFVEDRQAQTITDVIAATDPTVFSNGVSGAWSENYSIRGFSSNSYDMTLGGLYGMAPYYRTTPEMFERIEVLKGPSALLNGMPPGGSVGLGEPRSQAGRQRSHHAPDHHLYVGCPVRRTHRPGAALRRQPATGHPFQWCLP